MTERREQPADDTTDEDRQVKTRRRLTRDEQRRISETAKPGAVYRETSWTKEAREDLRRIERAVDELEAPGSHRAIARQRRARQGDVPAGLRSRITEALGSIAYVQLAYSTKEHHVCHVGRRQADSIEDVIVLVGPHDIRAFDQIQDAIDAMDVDTPTRETGKGPDPFGDVHEVEEIEGIGERYAAELVELGLEDTRELWHADTDRVAEALDASPKTVRLWQQMAELAAINGIGPQYAELLARSGVGSIEALANADPEDLLEAIETKQEDLLVRIQGNVVRKERVTGWIEKAREHDAKPT